MFTAGVHNSMELGFMFTAGVHNSMLAAVLPTAGVQRLILAAILETAGVHSCMSSASSGRKVLTWVKGVQGSVGWGSSLGVPPEACLPSPGPGSLMDCP